MPRKVAKVSQDTSKEMRPAVTPEARENQLINLAVNLAEKQLREGTASSQVITHYLRLGTDREKAEVERLRTQNALYEAKIKDLESAADIKELYKDAISAFKRYSGDFSDEEESDDQDIY